MIKSIIRSAYESITVTQSKIFTEIFQEVWPILRVILVRFKSNYDLIEILIQIMKYFMRGMGQDFKIYLEDYFVILLQGYQGFPISSYIYSLEVIASVFIKDLSVENLLKVMLKEFCVLTFTQYLRNFQELENNPHLTEDFFGFLYRLMQLNPCIILDFEMFEDVMRVCIQNIHLTHPESSKNLIYLLDKIITFQEIPRMKNMGEEVLSIYRDKVRSTLIKNGDELVEKIINYTLSVPPSIIYDNLKEMIKNIMIHFPNESTIWFQKYLQTLPQDCLTYSEKDKFIRSISNFNSDIMDDILENFYRRCLSRLYRQT
jgi:hypothetical protein